MDVTSSPPSAIPKTPSLTILHEKSVIRSAGKSAILSFLRSHKSLSVVRPSGKVVVFDSRISVQLAFYALVEHDMQCAPIWDADTREFKGLLTVTDFIEILRGYDTRGEPIAGLAGKRICDIVG
eukprot:CAMPEP_0182458296 /NCGR_PEP_ID=MMETSP1319-20130603/3674_1 /TAXON_ID=172717 /ORGANISM="Bolidomonas pacifica, Strain RCC208" /LENGTH=123 /DNA_ID=CAMNT_0024656959 /DNA_START=295 /DNA_END=662 /DNA_ORIENTATION=-